MKPIRQTIYFDKKLIDKDAQKVVKKEEAMDLLRKSNNINMVGKEIISLSTSIGIGSQEGIKEIDGIPFLIVFKM